MTQKKWVLDCFDAISYISQLSSTPRFTKAKVKNIIQTTQYYIIQSIIQTEIHAEVGAYVMHTNVHGKGVKGCSIKNDLNCGISSSCTDHSIHCEGWYQFLEKLWALGTSFLGACCIGW